MGASLPVGCPPRCPCVAGMPGVCLRGCCRVRAACPLLPWLALSFLSSEAWVGGGGPGPCSPGGVRDARSVEASCCCPGLAESRRPGSTGHKAASCRFSWLLFFSWARVPGVEIPPCWAGLGSRGVGHRGASCCRPGPACPDPWASRGPQCGVRLGHNHCPPCPTAPPRRPLRTVLAAVLLRPLNRTADPSPTCV